MSVSANLDWNYIAILKLKFLIISYESYVKDKKIIIIKKNNKKEYNIMQIYTKWSRGITTPVKNVSCKALGL